MIFTYDFIVTSSRGGPGGHDNGSWTGHGSKKDAKDCARSVGGYAWKVVRKGDNFKIKPIKVNREEPS